MGSLSAAGSWESGARLGCRAGSEAGVKVIVEHPDNSLLWKEPGWEALLDDQSWNDSLVDLCRFGSPFRKATRLRTRGVLCNERRQAEEVLGLLGVSQHLYDAGTLLHYYRQLVAHVQCELPACRPWIREAWEYVTRWEMLEPWQHRPPPPEPMAVLWGWKGGPLLLWEPSTASAGRASSCEGRVGYF